MGFNAVYPNGLGESIADSVAVNTPFYTTGNVWYVHATTGTDAASPAGQNRTKPLATIGQAYSNASSGDVIVLMDGHAETLTAVLTVAKRLLIVGGGQSDGKPTVKLTNNQASGSLLSLETSFIELRNIWFEENAQTNASARVAVVANGIRLRGCYFECGATDTGEAVSVDAVDNVEFESCTWISTATATGALPLMGVSFSDATNNTRFRECVLDGGLYGFSNYWVIDSETTAQVNITFENMSLLRGGDIIMNGSTTGWVGGVTATESALINFNGSGGA